MLFLFLGLDFYLQYGGSEREKQNIILDKEARVNGDVLTPLTPFNSLTPPITTSLYESYILPFRNKG